MDAEQLQAALGAAQAENETLRAQLAEALDQLMQRPNPKETACLAHTGC